MAQRYQNVHTSMIITVSSTKLVDGRRIYIFDNGSIRDDHWPEDMFSRYWEPLNDDSEQNDWQDGHPLDFGDN